MQINSKGVLQIRRKSPGKGKNKYKGPEVEIFLASSGNRARATMTGTQRGGQTQVRQSWMLS